VQSQFREHVINLMEQELKGLHLSR
jgi:hypothetical protein